MRKMYDSIHPELMPHDGDIYAGYVDGNWPTFHLLPAMFPGKILASIAAFPQDDAQILDVELFDATPQQAPGWAVRQRARGVIPTIYCNQLNSWSDVIQQFSVQNVAQPNYWVANYSMPIPAIPQGAIALQYGGVIDQYDVSLVANHWPGIDGNNEMLDATDPIVVKILAALNLDQFHPATVCLGSVYQKLGAIVTDPAHPSLQRIENSLGNLPTADEIATAVVAKLPPSSGGGITKQDVIDAINAVKMTTS